MIYWFTGQPGHGKTLHAIARALEFKAQGRMVYVCNVRGFNYEKAGMQKMTPDDFKNWMSFLPDGAVCLVDEAYEHDMLPKRAPSSKVPLHVERLATHRHRGIDFIFVCQSPDKQIDSFVHDLIERHVHVRRRFGTSFVHLREFDRFERNPEKATPITLKRTRLPKHVFGLYESTELDTTEKKIPWYFFVLWLGVPVGLGFVVWVFAGMGKRLGGEAPPPIPAAGQQKAAVTERSEGSAAHLMTADEYITSMTPRVASQPWTAPAYDGKLTLPSEAPRIFCMAGNSAIDGTVVTDSCKCVTEQGSVYRLELNTCALIARYGQYEPFRDESSQRYMSAKALDSSSRDTLDKLDRTSEPVAAQGIEQQASYGAMRGGAH